MKKQKEAVFQAVVSVFGDDFEGKVELSKEQKANVNNIVTQGILSGAVEYTKEMDEKAVKEYVPGLVSNWLRKDGRLNGGGKYTPKNPGSRAGQGDAQVKELRKLLAQQTDAAARAEIQGYINTRLAEIKPAKSITINMSALPKALQDKYAQ